MASSNLPNLVVRTCLKFIPEFSNLTGVGFRGLNFAVGEMASDRSDSTIADFQSKGYFDVSLYLSEAGVS